MVTRLETLKKDSPARKNSNLHISIVKEILQTKVQKLEYSNMKLKKKIDSMRTHHKLEQQRVKVSIEHHLRAEFRESVKSYI
jgi:hypothetical protein